MNTCIFGSSRKQVYRVRYEDLHSKNNEEKLGSIRMEISWHKSKDDISILSSNLPAV